VFHKRECDLLDLVCCLVGEFEAEMPDPRSAPVVEVKTRLLRLGAENGVAAADVGDHWMGAPGEVAE